MELVVGVTGATGTIYAIKLLEAFNCFKDIKVHLVMSEWAINNLMLETDCSREYINGLATAVYDNSNLGAKLASGSFITQGMVIIPCSMKSLSAIANGYADTLITRAADVTIKEGRKLVLCPRETPLNAIHIENMLKLSRLGVVIAPPMPAFYSQPRTIDDLVNHHAMKICDQFGLHYGETGRWNGLDKRL